MTARATISRPPTLPSVIRTKSTGSVIESKAEEAGFLVADETRAAVVREDKAEIVNGDAVTTNSAFEGTTFQLGLQTEALEHRRYILIEDGGDICRTNHQNSLLENIIAFASRTDAPTYTKAMTCQARQTLIDQEAHYICQPCPGIPGALKRTTVCPPNQRSPVALSTRPSRPASPIRRLHLAHTGRISRRQEEASFGSPLQAVSAHLPGASRSPLVPLSRQ